jgi:nucleoside phosphorylase
MAVFAALGWERRLVTKALAGASRMQAGRWVGTLGDGGSCLVIQPGVGPIRAAEQASIVPAAGVLVTCGCAGALVPWLRAGDLVVATSVLEVDAGGRSRATLPAASDALAAWATRSGFRIHVGPLVSVPAPLATGDAKREAGRDGALAVEMESGAVAAEAARRGVPFAAIRVILDEVGDDLDWAGGTIDPASGEIRMGAALAAIAMRPGLWPRAVGLARRHRVATDRLGRFVAALLADGSQPFHADAVPANAASS